MTQFVSRKDAGLRPPRGGYVIGTVSKVVCHHTPGIDGLGQYGRATELWRGIQRSHLGNGWADIGYTWGVSGELALEGRGWGMSGAHAPGANSISVGIAFLLDGRERGPTHEEWQTAHDIVRQGIEGGHVTPAYEVSGHRDWVATQCPADGVYDHLGDLSLVPTAPSPITPEVQAVAYSAARMDVVVVGSDANLYHRFLDIPANRWVPSDTSYTPMGAPPGGGRDPAVAWAGDWLYVFAVSKADGLLWHKCHHPEHKWSDWSPLPDVSPQGAPAVAVRYVQS